MLDRRTFIAATAALAAACRAEPRSAGPDEAARKAAAGFEAIRATLGPGGRLGVAAIDTGSGRKLEFDSRSLYPLASTFKLPLAAFVLKFTPEPECFRQHDDVVRLGVGEAEVPGRAV